MKYDYTFFANHAARRRQYKAPLVKTWFMGAGFDFFRSESEVENHHEVVFTPEDEFYFETPSIIRCNGAYFKGGDRVAPLETSLRTKLPEDFTQFYEQFGECLILTRSEPIIIDSVKQMVQDFEDDAGNDVLEGRFFRFAHYQDPVYLGLRRDDRTDAWQVVVCTYGLLYTEMIGPLGRDNVVAPSFYDWLKHLIETDAYPDNIYPRDNESIYVDIVDG